MPLPTGSRLGAYEIIAPLGAGGMGAVFHARDTRLGRAVAIKVILETFASDPERVARFEREARMLASLHHPRIASLFGMEQDDGRHFLVMELVEGETIADRLRRGAMPAEEAVTIAVQIAEALEAAHERGVVHRDLKPANVKVTADRQVKVLDFGLAKAMEADANPADVANSPTLSMMATQAGVILGTAAYMSPEQAKGFPADHRSDIFSFGSMLYEMLTARPPFQGDTAPEILASILVREPEIGSLPPDLHPRLVDLIMRCLEKSPKRRWQHIGDVRAELESLSAAPRSQTMPAAVQPPRPLWRRALIPGVVVIAAAAMTGAAAWNLRPEPSRPVIRIESRLPDGQNWAYLGRNLLALSPDGTRLVYAAGNKLYIRLLSEFAGSLLPGTASLDVVTTPAFSPDGRFVAVYVVREQMLKKVPVSGGAAVNLCPASNPFSIFWSRDGFLYFSTTQQGVLRVSENGGKPEDLVRHEGDERFQGARPLADGATILMSVARGSAMDRWDLGQVVAHNLRTGERKVLVEGGSDPRLLPGGYLAYAHRGVVYAAAFDEDRLAITGSPVPILEGVRRMPGNTAGGAQYAFASDGTLVYVDGPVNPETSTEVMAITDAKGNVTPLRLAAGEYIAPRASRDGRRVVFEANQGAEAIYVYDLDETSAVRKLTFEGRSRRPIFTPDGARVTFWSAATDGKEQGLFWIRTDGTGGLEQLTKPENDEAHVPESFSPDGKTLLYSAGKGTRWTLRTLSMDTRESRQFTATIGAGPLGAVFHPGGKWVAYAAPVGTAHNVIVEPFPATGARYELARKTGDDPHHPLWSRDGKTLYVTARPGGVDAIPVVTAPTFAFGNALTIPHRYRTAAPANPRTHDILPDGRFIAAGLSSRANPGGGLGADIRIVINWFEDVKSRLPGR